MGQGDVPTSPGGPLRRRREKRQLEHLVGEAKRRAWSDLAARAHVSVLEERVAPEAPKGDPPAEVPPEPGPEPRAPGFHVHAIPIDQPFDEPPSRG